MRRPTDIEALYIDFDAFFANVERQLDPTCREKAVGVTSLDSDNAALITRCYTAKRHGIARGMRVADARALCPDLVLKPARHDVYVDFHNRIKASIEQHLPIRKVWSIDEVECVLMGREKQTCVDIVNRIRDSLAKDIGEYVTPSIGLAPNQFLAKVAAEMNKPNGLTVLRPEDLPGPLLNQDLTDLPGIAKGLRQRLENTGIVSVGDLWNISAKHARKIWGSVEGERFWAQLHGYAITRPDTKRAMFGHSRVLTGNWQTSRKALECLRLLTVKAAYRMRREGYTAGAMSVTLRLNHGRWQEDCQFPACRDDHSLLEYMQDLFEKALKIIGPSPRLAGVYVMLHDIKPVGHASGDLFDDTVTSKPKARWEDLTHLMDRLNEKHEKCIIHLGTRAHLPGGYAGAKIAFGRVPDKQDFM